MVSRMLGMFTHELRYLQLLADVCIALPLGVNMAFFEQAAVLATAWANNEELKALGAKQSLLVVRAKKLSRGHLHYVFTHGLV